MIGWEASFFIMGVGGVGMVGLLFHRNLFDIPCN